MAVSIKRYSIKYLYTLCASLVKIGPVTLEISRGYQLHLFGRDGQNWHIPPNILAHTRPIFISFSALVYICMRIIKLT